MTTAGPRPGETKTAWVAYLVALGAVVAATLLRFAVDPLLGDTAQFVPFFVAVVLTGAIGGRAPALMATALSFVSVTYFFFEPRHAFRIEGVASAVALAMFAIGASSIAWIAGRMHAAQRTLTYERERLEVMLASIADAVVATDEVGRVTFLNLMASMLTGWTSEAAVGRPLLEVIALVDESTGRRGDDVVARVLRERRAVTSGNGTCLLVGRGRPVPVESSAAPLVDATGRLVGVVLVIRDLSEKRAARAALVESETRLRLAQQAAGVGTFEWNIGTGVSTWTPELETLYGLPAGSFRGTQHAWEDLVHPDDRSEAVRQVALAMEKGAFEGEWRVRWPDGTEHWLYGRGRVFHDDAGIPTRLLGVNIDITARKRAEAQVRNLSRRLESILNAAGDGICGLDADDRIVLVNPAFASMLGWEPAEILGKVGHASFHHSLPSGEPFPTEQCAMHAAVREGVAARGATVFWRKDGTSFPVEYAYTPNPDGTDVMSVLIVRDTTERTRAEVALLDAKQSAERAKAVAEEATQAKDHFLAVLSHELRTPLTPVVAVLELLHEQERGSELAHYVDIMRRNIDLEARLIDDLLDVTRITRGKVELAKRGVDLVRVIDDAVEVCRPDIDARRIHFGVDLGPGGYVVEADSARLQQVFWNLLKNAVKFTPFGGCIGIRCRPAGSAVLVEVNDSGVGIAPDLLAHVFDAFRQAERSMTRQFGGLGLGLTISKALVELHGGSISAHSDGHGCGTTIRVTLPLVDAARQGALAAQDPETAPAQGLRVLLVEDHGDTAAVMQCALEGRGCDVLTAGDVATAISLATRERFDVLVSDVGLPDASGHDLLRELRARGHMLPAIALSGYGQESDRQLSQEAGFAMHLVKPLRPAVLTEAVVRVAGERAADVGNDRQPSA